MNIGEARDFMREYFEKLYKKYADIDPVLVEMPDLPEEMWADGATPDDEGWCAWKLIPSMVTADDIAEYEEEYGFKFPNGIKAFLGTYHHCFESPIGKNMPDDPFEALDNAFNPHLVSAMYLPFTWDKDGYFIRCIDMSADEDGDRCPVVQFDHEVLFDCQYDFEDKDEAVPREKLEELAENVADSFCDYLNGVYDGSIDGK